MVKQSEESVRLMNYHYKISDFGRLVFVVDKMYANSLTY